MGGVELPGNTVWTAKEDCTIEVTEGSGYLRRKDGHEEVLEVNATRDLKEGDKFASRTEGCKFRT